LKTWCIREWNLHYMLTDDLAAEQAAVKKAFLKLKAEKQKVNHLLCRVHSNCTLQRYVTLLENYSLTALQTALWTQWTVMRCDEFIEKALCAASSQKAQDYIIKEWQKTKRKWAAYARQHSLLLLQVSAVTIDYICN